MSRDVGHRVADVLVAVERCRRYVAALDGDGDLVDMAEDAIERNLQIIGEAVNHLPAEITDAHPEIGWPQIEASATSSSISTSGSTSMWFAMSSTPISRRSPRRCATTSPTTDPIQNVQV